MIGTRVDEAEVKRIMGAAFTPKLSMVAALDATYSKVNGEWTRYPSGGLATKSTGLGRLSSDLLEGERQEHGRAEFEDARDGEI